MKFVFKILSLMLIPAILLAMPAAGAWANSDHASAPSTPLGERMARCHGQAGHRLPDSSPTNSSSPHSPVSYLCCITGPVVAAVHAFASLQSPTQSFGIPRRVESFRTELAWNWLEVRTIAFADPPCLTSLRI